MYPFVVLASRPCTLLLQLIQWFFFYSNKLPLRCVEVIVVINWFLWFNFFQLHKTKLRSFPLNYKWKSFDKNCELHATFDAVTLLNINGLGMTSVKARDVLFMFILSSLYQFCQGQLFTLTSVIIPISPFDIRCVMKFGFSS